MALFKRATLKEKGMTDEQIDYLMTESNRALAADYLPKTDVQTQIDAALAEEAKKNPKPIPVEESDAYKAVVAERDMLRALGGETFKDVKPKFRESVYCMIDRSDGAPEITEQLKTIKEQYEEYFDAEPAKSPQFGARVQGTMPTGKTSPSFGDYWNFGGKTKGE